MKDPEVCNKITIRHLEMCEVVFAVLPKNASTVSHKIIIIMAVHYTYTQLIFSYSGGKRLTPFVY
jgi:hypothetical protein